MDIEVYNHIRSGGSGFYEQRRGLIAVWGKEAVPFLDGMISNDMKTLEDGQQMVAAFPNAQGRLLAVVRVLRQGDRFLIETEEATREKVFNNLFRFTYAGDFFVEDLSEGLNYFELFNSPPTKEGWPRFADGVVLWAFSLMAFPKGARSTTRLTKSSASNPAYRSTAPTWTRRPSFPNSASTG